MTSLHQAIADNLILDPETGEWVKNAAPIVMDIDIVVDGGTEKPLGYHLWEKEQTDHE